MSQPTPTPGTASRAPSVGAPGDRLFMNPSNHRRVDFKDPTEAVEIVLLADLLLRVLDKIEDPQSARPDAGREGG